MNTIAQKEIVTSIINNTFRVSQKSMEDFMALVDIELIKKGSHFIKRNKPNHAEYFLLEGVCRSYVTNEDGEHISISFFQKRSVITPHIIRTMNGISNLDFETLTDCEIGIIKAEDLLNLMIENIEIRTFANTVLQQELIQKVNKEITMAACGGKDRLLELRKRYPNIENLIPHGMIASYLGITPISLSRLRKEISLE